MKFWGGRARHSTCGENQSRPQKRGSGFQTGPRSRHRLKFSEDSVGGEHHLPKLHQNNIVTFVAYLPGTVSLKSGGSDCSVAELYRERNTTTVPALCAAHLPLLPLSSLLLICFLPFHILSLSVPLLLSPSLLDVFVPPFVSLTVPSFCLTPFLP